MTGPTAAARPPLALAAIGSGLASIAAVVAVNMGPSLAARVWRSVLASAAIDSADFLHLAA